MKPKGQMIFGIAAILAVLAAYWIGTQHRVESHTTTHTETVRWRNDSLPIPFAVPGKDCTVVELHHFHDTTWAYRVQNFRDTLYADCDTATRYTIVHSDSNAKVTYTADICGRLLNHRMSVDAYRHTAITTVVTPRSEGIQLYATASSAGCVGVSGAYRRWLMGYQYSGFGPQPWQRHALAVGFRIYPFK